MCAHVTNPNVDLCADRQQLTACAGLATYAHCGSNGRCYDGVCLPVSCGNGRIDRADPADATDNGEICDDSNETSGDGCSSDCRSNETCGNGIVDAIATEVCDNENLLSNDGCDSACLPETARWSTSANAPNDRSQSSIAFDADRDRVVRFSGRLVMGSSEAIDATWEAAPTGWQRRAPADAPPGFGWDAMAYDAAHRRTVLFDGSQFGGTWLWDGTNWSHPPVVGPTPRSGAALAYDAEDRRTILFGGQTYDELGHPTDETWIWDGSGWTQLVTDHAPPPRAGHAMAYDPTRGVTVLVGEFRSGPEVWELSDGPEPDWNQVATTSGPTDVSDPSLAFDPASRAVLLVDSSPPFQAWSWNGTTWTPLGTLPSPLPQAGARIATDTRRGEVVLVGYARVDLTHPAVAGLWRWNGTSWSFRDVSGTNAGYGLVRMVYDARRAKVVAASADGSSEFDGSSWTDPVKTGPVNRLLPGLAYDPRRGLTLLFGGTLDELGDDMWTWDGATWVELQPAHRPSPRSAPSLVWHTDEKRALLFGGSCKACQDSATTWIWDGADWTASTLSPSPAPRSVAASAYDPIRREVVLFGGRSGNDELGDTWTWRADTWVSHPVPGPSPRVGAAMAWDASRQRVVLVGGHANQQQLQDVWEWDGAAWTRVAVDGFLARENPGVATSPGGGVVMYGGFGGSVPLTDTTALRWEATHPVEACRADIDGDGDGLAGCADPDCWWACTPLCFPGTTCDPATPHCGDGTCTPPIEDDWICPADCAHATFCGDSICDPLTETAATCPGDCRS